MDKTLEIVMVAVALVIAVVVVTSMLQGQASSFGNFASNQTSSSNCGIATTQLSSSIDCSASTPDASGIPAYENNEDCWNNENDAEDAVC